MLNAHCANAHTYAAGSAGVTRGILVGQGSKAALAALLGHELAHVNARHTAQQQGRALMMQPVMAGRRSAPQPPIPAGTR